MIHSVFLNSHSIIFVNVNVNNFRLAYFTRSNTTVVVNAWHDATSARHFMHLDLPIILFTYTLRPIFVPNFTFLPIWEVSYNLYDQSVWKDTILYNVINYWILTYSSNFKSASQKERGDREKRVPSKITRWIDLWKDILA